MSDYTDLEARLRITPLYHSYGEAADLPEQAADAIAALRAERDACRAAGVVLATRARTLADAARECRTERDAAVAALAQTAPKGDT